MKRLTGHPVERVAVIGLDCAAPQLVFHRFAGELPVLQGLLAAGVWGELESVDPPITVPAWACAMTGCDPGQLGIYGFRKRIDHGYGEPGLVDSTDVRRPAVWDTLSRAKRQVIVLGVPPSYPPRRVAGCMVGCQLTPSTSRRYTYPADLAGEITRVVGDYAVDVADFRRRDRGRLIGEICDMTKRRFRLFRHLLKTRPWAFAMMVEIGLDRMHHGFWSCFDEGHPRFVPGHPHGNAILDYYRLVDREIGEVLQQLDDDTAVMVLSDHGAQALQGGFCISSWLRRHGYLKLRAEQIDWRQTRAWAEGGYCARVYLNVRGREPEGIVDPAEAPALCAQLSAELSKEPDEQGRALPWQIFRPADRYREVRGIPPDLIVYIGDLRFRAVGSMGHGALWIAGNDTGPDEANHAMQGIFILRCPGLAERGQLTGLRLIDCGPTILRLLGH